MPAAPPRSDALEQTEALTAERQPHSDPPALTGNGVKASLPVFEWETASAQGVLA